MRSAIVATGLIFACTGVAFAVGSAIGEVGAGSGAFSRDNASSPANTGGVVFGGDGVSTTGSQVRVDLLEGGDVSLLENSNVQFGDGILNFGASGGGCFTDLSGPINVVVDGNTLASGVTSGGVFNGVFYASCPLMMAAVDNTGTQGAALSNSIWGAFGFAAGALILDEASHGN